MYDQYDSPHPEESEDDSGMYEQDPMEKASEIGGSAASFLKENWRKLALLIVVLAVAYFTYDYFVGGVKQVTFSVADTEGAPVHATVKVSGQDGKEVATVNSGKAVQLRLGSYTVDVQAQGYKVLAGHGITVSDSGTVPLVLEADKDLQLSGSFPDTLATGEDRAMQLVITNTGTATVNADLTLGGDAKDAMQISYQKPLSLIPGDNRVQVTLKVNDNPPDSALGSGKDGVIRVVGLGNASAKVEGKYSLIKFSQAQLSVTFNGSDSRADFGTIKAGASPDDNKKTITVRNSNEVAINDIEASVNVTSAEFSDKNEVEKWFEFVPSNTASVNANDTASIDILPHVPASVSFPPGQDTETIAGTVEVKSSFFDKTFQLSLQVQRLKAGIDVSNIQDTITMAANNGAYTAQTGSIEIRNTGEVLLTGVTPRVNCDSQGVAWLKLVDVAMSQDGFQLEQNAQPQGVPYTISVPDGTPANTITHCTLGVLYKANGVQQPTYTKVITIVTS